MGALPEAGAARVERGGKECVVEPPFGDSGAGDANGPGDMAIGVAEHEQIDRVLLLDRKAVGALVGGSGAVGQGTASGLQRLHF